MPMAPGMSEKQAKSLCFLGMCKDLECSEEGPEFAVDPHCACTWLSSPVPASLEIIENFRLVMVWQSGLSLIRGDPFD